MNHLLHQVGHHQVDLYTVSVCFCGPFSFASIAASYTAWSRTKVLMFFKTLVM
jgi:hypothetical protein